jgi:putative transposase
MRLYKLGAHTKTDVTWIPKYRKKVLTGPVAVRTRDILRQIVMEHEIEIISGNVANDHIYMFLSYRPMQNISKIMQWLKGISSHILLQEFPHLKKQFWGRHLWARGYLAVSSGNITDEMIQQYIEEQEGEPVADDSRLQIDPSSYRRGWFSSYLTFEQVYEERFERQYGFSRPYVRRFIYRYPWPRPGFVY